MKTREMRGNIRIWSFPEPASAPFFPPHLLLAYSSNLFILRNPIQPIHTDLFFLWCWNMIVISFESFHPIHAARFTRIYYSTAFTCCNQFHPIHTFNLFTVFNKCNSFHCNHSCYHSNVLIPLLSFHCNNSIVIIPLLSFHAIHSAFFITQFKSIYYYQN